MIHKILNTIYWQLALNFASVRKFKLALKFLKKIEWNRNNKDSVKYIEASLLFGYLSYELGSFKEANDSLSLAENLINKNANLSENSKNYLRSYALSIKIAYECETYVDCSEEVRLLRLLLSIVDLNEVSVKHKMNFPLLTSEKWTKVDKEAIHTSSSNNDS